MRIASITMIGQFPDGIDIHTRNLKWALGEEDHSYIITIPWFIEKYRLKNDSKVTYIPFIPKKRASETGFINFWHEFPDLIKNYNINPEWFLFMEEDIWFFAKPYIPEKELSINAFLARGDTRNVMVNDNLLHSRVWEGAQIIHKNIVKDAINFGINFSFVRDTFFHREKEYYEKKFNGEITLSKYQQPDTFDEFGLYCALVKHTRINHDLKAVHVRGPESVHRLYPELYSKCSMGKIKEVQSKLSYIDVMLVVGIYYLVGLWDSVDHLDWNYTKKNSKQEIDRLLSSDLSWMNDQEIKRLNELNILMNNS